MERADDPDNDFFQVVFRVFGAEFWNGAFFEQLSVVDDTDMVTEAFDFAHDVSGKNDGLPAIATVGDETDDSAGSHHVEAGGGFVEDRLTDRLVRFSDGLAPGRVFRGCLADDLPVR